MPAPNSLNSIEFHHGHCADRENNPDRTFVDIIIPVLGEELAFSISYSQTQASLSELAAVCREISDLVLSKVRQTHNSPAESIACKNGCDACCHYMVPLSSAEAFALKEEVRSMTRNRKRNAIRKMVLAARRILEHQVPKLVVDQSGLAESSILREMSNFYKNLKPACPFLENHSCSIYDRRPLACREHLASGSPSGCRNGISGKSRVVAIPISIAEVLNNVSNHLEGTDSESIILPIALIWCDDNSDRESKMYSAGTLVNTLAKFLHLAAEKANTAPAATA